MLVYQHCPPKRLACVARGQEEDIYKLLQLTDADDLDRTAYALYMKQPHNGFFDTPAFKRVRSNDLDLARRKRTVTAFKVVQRNLRGKKKSQASHTRGPTRGQTSSSTSVVDSRRTFCIRGFETKQEGKGRKATQGQKANRGKAQTDVQG